MINGADAAVAALTQRFLLDYPHEASRRLEGLPVEQIAGVLVAHPPHAVLRAWSLLTPDVAGAVLAHLPQPLVALLVAEAEPAVAVGVLARADAAERSRLLGQLEPDVARELAHLLEYPDDSAGRLMDPVTFPLRAGVTVGDALARLRRAPRRGMRELFVVDDDGRLSGRVEIQDLAVAEEALPLREIVRPLVAVVQDLAPRTEVVETLQQHALSGLPVIDHDGRYVGIIRPAALMSALERETSVDIQTMVGASRDERALSGPLFAVRKRLPWLQINLLTAFLAAAVVGMFEGLIAKVTALAVLLPVVAGQSGNAGAQALAVTMRGIVLREIGMRQWPRMVWKEASVGLINGLAVAATAAIGVYLWSRSGGLVLVIGLAMVISMIIAGVAGAMVPIVLNRLGQDPAQSSSIVLTTVTDVAGFLSFLGIATALSFLLVPAT